MYSIIMPTYKNNESTLKRAILSVCNQVITTWELIIVCDNSVGDEYYKMVEELSKDCDDQRISFIFNDKNEGANASRNKGIKKANGDFIAFLDADDEWHSNYLYDVNSLVISSNPEIISTGYRIVTIKRDFIEISNENDGYLYNKMIYRDCVGPTSAVVVKKSAIERAGYFDESMPGRQDYDMWLRISEFGRICYVRKANLSIYRIGNDSITTRGLNHIIGTEIIMDKLLKNEQLKKKHRKIKGSHYAECARFSLVQEKYELAVQYAILSLKSFISFEAFIYLIMGQVPVIAIAMISIKRRVRR